MLLLDTHVWVWSAAGDTRRIGRRARQALARAESRGAVRVSAVTLFELVALHTLGRLRLARPLDEWMRESMNAGGIRVMELSSAAAADAGAISRDALGDPIDRLIVATARQLDATLMSGDARILSYAADHADVQVLDART